MQLRPVWEDSEVYLNPAEGRGRELVGWALMRASTRLPGIDEAPLPDTELEE
jgi:hypothetical protein